MNKTKIRIAAAATVISLAGLTGLALGSGGESQEQTATTAADPVVRTKVIRRTVHVTKQAKPKRPAASGSAATASTSSAVARPVSTAAAPEPVTTGSSSAGTSEPVTTGSSTTGASEHEYEAENEHEYEDEAEHEYEGGSDD